MLNLEETVAFNHTLGRFLRYASDGTWAKLAPDDNAGAGQMERPEIDKTR